MKGAGTTQIPLSGLSIIWIETGKGSGNVASTGDSNRMEWALKPANDVRHQAICEYDDEIIGVFIDPAMQRCWLERKPGAPGSVTTWCARTGSAAE